MVLEAGDPAPEVTARNQHGESVAIDADGPTVVYFYPRDDTPGCTIEAKQFELERATYDDAGVTILGVSTDSVESHAAFCDAYDLSFDLLADPDGTLADAFDVPLNRNTAARTTFVLLDGEIHAVYTDVNPDGHARDILSDLLEEGIVSLPE